MATVDRIERGISNSVLRMPYAFAWLDCGHSAKEAPVGTQVDCPRCHQQVAAVAELRAALAIPGLVSHTRMRPWCGENQVHVYRHAPESPTGVLHLLTVEDGPEVQALLRGGLSPLSPTEPR